MMKFFLTIIFLLFFFGCTLFQKTSKEKVQHIESSSSQLELSQLVLKNANKETQVFTYWNDSGFYQHSYTTEEINQSDASHIKADENLHSKQTLKMKRAEPTSLWNYLLIFLVLTSAYLVTRKYNL